jgi:hypothetical protein
MFCKAEYITYELCFDLYKKSIYVIRIVARQPEHRLHVVRGAPYFVSENNTLGLVLGGAPDYVFYGRI